MTADAAVARCCCCNGLLIMDVYFGGGGGGSGSGSPRHRGTDGLAFGNAKNNIGIYENAHPAEN